MKKLLLIMALGFITACPAFAAKVLFLAGADSHGFGKHAHHEVCQMLANAVEDSGLDIETAMAADKWPEDMSVFDGVSALVVYGDGDQDHIMNGHAAELDALTKKGMGLVVLHFALEVGEAPLRKAFLDTLGGYFEVNWSVNPDFVLEDAKLSAHPAARGVQVLSLKDEWYYHMRFREGMSGVTPVLSVLPPESTLAPEDGPRSGNPALRAELAAGKAQHLCWATENEGRGRGFGFSGGHYQVNFADENYRKLVLNGIVWAAGLEVPENGLSSEKPLIPKSEKMLSAVALGDAEDVKVHLALGAPADEKNSAGWTALHYAAVRNQAEVGKVLIEAGADVNALTSTNNAPIHMAAERGYVDFVRLLAAKGADLNLPGNAGWTALHTAAAKDKLDVARALVELGANVQALSDARETPIH